MTRRNAATPLIPAPSGEAIPAVSWCIASSSCQAQRCQLAGDRWVMTRRSAAPWFNLAAPGASSPALHWPAASSGVVDLHATTPGYSDWMEISR